MSDRIIRSRTDALFDTGVYAIMIAFSAIFHYPVVYIINFIQLVAGKAFAGSGVAQGIYDSVAGYPDTALNGLAPKVFGVAFRWSKMKGGELAGHTTVHLLRPGAPAVEGTKSGLHVAYGDMRIKGRKRGGEGCSRISMDEDESWLLLLVNRGKAVQDAGGDVRKALPALHDVEVVLRRDAELTKDAVKHFAVLCGDADNAFKLGPALQLENQRGHLYCLRPCAEDGHDFKLCHPCPPEVHRSSDRRADGICGP